MSKKEGEAGGAPATEEVKVDAFGGEGDHPAPPTENEGGEGKKDEKKFDTIPDDHPTIVALKKQIDDVKAEYGGNLSGQRDVIDKLEKKIDALSKGTAAEGEDANVLFKKEDIKWSKDLTKEQRDEMTETEIKQMDEIAGMKESQNKIFAQLNKDGKTETAVADIQGWVKDSARELSRGEDGKLNTELANQIIESVKQFALEGLTEDQVKERVANAAKLVPDYKAPKEQGGKKGKTVAAGGAADDPFGVDAVVANVQKGKNNKGSYQL